MRIGYCSPFNPMKSGISDFSEELIFSLKKYMEIVIFSPVMPTNEKILKHFEVHKLSELNKKDIRETLDVIVYRSNAFYQRAEHASLERKIAREGVLLYEHRLEQRMA